MTTIEQTERTEIARDVKDLAIEVYNKKDRQGIKRSIVNKLAWAALVFSASAVGGGTVDLLTDHDYSAPKIVVVYGGLAAVGGVGYAGLSRRVKGYDIEITRLDVQNSALLDAYHPEQENKEKAAKATVPSASE